MTPTRVPKMPQPGGAEEGAWMVKFSLESCIPSTSVRLPKGAQGCWVNQGQGGGESTPNGTLLGLTW